MGATGKTLDNVGTICTGISFLSSTVMHFEDFAKVFFLE